LIPPPGDRSIAGTLRELNENEPLLDALPSMARSMLDRDPAVIANPVRRGYTKEAP